MPVSTIHGGFKTETVALTDAAATTGSLNKKGYAFGCVFNESGGSVTLTYYSKTPSGAAIPCVDSNDVAITQTVGDDEVADLPGALAGMPVLLPVLASGTASLEFHLER